MPTAKILINITSFAANGNGFCVIQDPYIQDQAGNRLRYKDGTGQNRIVVAKSNGKSALGIEFHITPDGDYTADSIGFVNLDPNGPAGTQDFNDVRKNGNRITVADLFNDIGLPAKWKYSIGVTQVASPNQSGTIDPGIENEA